MFPVSALILGLQFTASTVARAEGANKFTPAQLKEDFRIARHALEEGHPGLYRLTKKAEMDRVFDQAEKSLDHPMDFYEFYRVMALPIAAIKCGADGKCYQTNDPLTSLQSPSQPGFKGPVYILINGRCFSAGAEFLTEVHFHHRATFIGEESAGAYYGNNSGDVPRITLPNTRLGLFIPLVSGYMSVGGTHDHDPAHGIMPDFPVKYTIADMLAGADKDLPLALELSRKSP
jgi:hypothetical protein